MNLNSIDIIVFISYLVGLATLGLYLSFKTKKQSVEDYFLASKSLPWWAVGGSLIASNISAEQFIGMSGSGYAVGMAIAAYEFMAAFTLILIAKYFLPIFLKEQIYTIPQFLERRFDKRVKIGLSVFWVFLFVFVNITSILYLGSLALQQTMGIDIFWGVMILAVFASTFSIFGGLKAVVWTDVIQVIVLIFGGLMASVLVLNAIGGDIWNGFITLVDKAPEKFDMILDKSNKEYTNLPGISVLIGGMWIANLYYWGTNQYIIQRSLAAKSIKEAQKGAMFAAFIKILLPLIVVVPGIAAYVLGADITKNDEAYPWILNNYVNVGAKGLVFAALISAIGSSLSSLINSTSTIFTLDIYKSLRKNANDNHLVKVGKISGVIILLIGIVMAPSLQNLDQAFQYIQEYTGFISPGVVAIFILGMFWKKTTSLAALIVVIASIPLSVLLKFFTDIPFLDRMGICFLILMFTAITISYVQLGKNNNNDKYISIDNNLFKTSTGFNVSFVIITIILAVIYIGWW